ncbi:MAG TPA: zinc ABC transporter substrate-binding protein [Anaerolineales bacterium]|nr:zinc ABC transporter substrate-binding protein [Anaerolineales bacterium]
MIDTIRKLTYLLVTFSILIAACNSGSVKQTASSKLNVVVTFSVLNDLVQNVGGDNVKVHTLVRPGLDAHTFEPSPADSKTLAEASLIFENGLKFEPWLDDLYTASGASARRIVVSEGIEPLANEDGELDPHVWHSAVNTIRITENIRDALAQADPANAATYSANADAFIAQLQELDAWIFAEVENLPAERRKLITTHDTFAYFAERYGFSVIGTLLPTSTEGASPSAQEVAQLVEAIKEANVPAVFAENVSSNTLLRQVADEAGVAVTASLYTDALGPAGSDGDTYLNMMRYNVQTIVTELGR